MNKDERLLQILDHSACLNNRQMMAYIKGTLFPEELRAVELHLAACDLCNDALEGFQKVQDPEALTNELILPAVPALALPEKKAAALSASNHQPQTPVSEKRQKTYPPEKSIPHEEPLVRRKKDRAFSGAVGVAALLVVGFGLVWFFEFRKNNNTASDQADILALMQPDTLLRQESETTAIHPPAHPAPEKIAVQDTLPTEEVVRKTDTIKTAEKKQEAEKTEVPMLAVASKVSLKEKKDSDSGQEVPKKTFVQETKESAAPPQTVAAAQPEVKSKTPTLPKPKTGAKADEKNTGSFSDFETGVSLYKKKEYASALLYLKTAESDDTNPHHWDAVYYSALCNLKLGREGKAKRDFKRVIKSTSALKSAAEKQLSEIEKR